LSASAETIMDLRIGDIFNSRVAGNVENSDILGSMEFACKLAGAKVVLVMGHTSCGAIKGAIDNAELGNLTGLLTKIKPAVAATTYAGERTSKNYAFVDAVARKNVEMTMADIRKDSPVLAEMESNGAIKIAGAMYMLVRNRSPGSGSPVGVIEGPSPETPRRSRSGASGGSPSRSISPRNSATAVPAGQSRAIRVAGGRDRRYAGDAALCARAEAACDVDRQRRPRPIVRESDVVRPTLGGPEIGVASTEAFACQLNVLACLAIAAGRRLSSSMNTEVGPGGSKGQSRSVPMDARMLDSRPSTTVRAAQGERRRTNWHLPCRKAENTRICATFGSY
jgi:hypothetical protein